MSWATGATDARSPNGSGSDNLNKIKAIPPFWKAVSIDTAVIWGIFNLENMYTKIILFSQKLMKFHKDVNFYGLLM